jgi:hypothetical protein
VLHLLVRALNLQQIVEELLCEPHFDMSIERRAQVALTSGTWLESTTIKSVLQPG